MPATGPIGKRRVMPSGPRGGHQVEGDRLADDALRLLRPEAEGQHRAIDLDQRVPDGLARLARDEPPELLAPGADASADVAQDRAPLIGRQAARHLEGRHGRRDGLLVLRRGGGVGVRPRAPRDGPGRRPRADRASRPSDRPGRWDGASWRRWPWGRAPWAAGSRSAGPRPGRAVQRRVGPDSTLAPRLSCRRGPPLPLPPGGRLHRPALCRQSARRLPRSPTA